MAEISELWCPVCGGRFAPGAVPYFCVGCGPVGTLAVQYDYDALRGMLDRARVESSEEHSMWRYRDLMPIGAESRVPPLRAGWTPLYDADRIADMLGVRQVWLKDDGQNPTGSLKDRASAMIVARALEQGIKVVSTASTGNAAAALAGMAASVGLRTVIFVPATAPEAKIAQLLVYGATVLLVEDSYDVAFDLCYEMCVEEGWYCRNTALNPITTEGKKTVAYEIAEQLNWNVPDVVVVSVGDGNIISGVYKGFYDLWRLGWIERIPRLIGVQAAGSSPLVDAWERGVSGAEMQPVRAESIADSIVAGLPRDRVNALRAVRDTDGAFIAVSDDEILAAIPALARLSGVFAEPAAAASFAGLQGAVQSKLINPDETVVLLVTGNGLKDVRRAQQSVSGGLRVEPNLLAIREKLRKHEIS